MNEYLAVVTMEECAEIQQGLAKALRFGFDDSHPDRLTETNDEEILTEFYQLTAMIEELQKQQVISRFSEEEIANIKREKIEKVYHYMAYSKEKGLLEERSQ